MGGGGPPGGGYWAFPSSFVNAHGKTIRGRLPTPPGTRYRGADGEEYDPETNVAPGAAGSKVILWARGSAFMATQSADFLWFLGLFLSQQTLAGAPRAFGNEGGNYFPAALDGWVRTYASLVGLYGAENVVVAGDSAGAGLTLATLLDALCHLDTPLPAPAGMLLFSPFCDISDDSFDPAKAPARLAFHAKEGGLQKYGGSDYLPFPGYRYPCVAYGSAAQRRTSLASPGRASKEELDALLRSGVKILLNFGGMELLQASPGPAGHAASPLRLTASPPRYSAEPAAPSRGRARRGSVPRQRDGLLRPLCDSGRDARPPRAGSATHPKHGLLRRQPAARLTRVRGVVPRPQMACRRPRLGRFRHERPRGLGAH